MKTGAQLKINLKDTAMLKIILPVFALLVLLMTSNVFAQTQAVPPRRPVTPRPAAPISKRISKKVQNESGIPAEKYIAADSKVNISLRVCDGNVKINGWDRDQIRAFVNNGSQVGFAVRNKNSQTSKPDLLRVVGFDPEKNNEGESDECLSGDEIELDVPRGAFVNLTTSESDIAIRSVSRVKIENNDGNISLGDISQGVNARTYEGNITIEKSSGPITLSSTNGSIVILETASNDVGDALTAKTISGTIMLQQVAQKQVSASSNTGSIRFDGNMETGGQYSFVTTNGNISLLIPDNSSYRVDASYGGNFKSEIPLKTLTEEINPQVKRLVAVSGAGDASVTLKNYSGNINIRKK